MVEGIRCAAAAAASLFVLSLSACAAPAEISAQAGGRFGSVDVSQFSDVRATVDTEHHEIAFPIDAYLMTSEDADLVDRAFQVEYAACMSSEGAAYTIPTGKLSERMTLPERRYGLWGLEAAAAYGYALSPGTVPVKPRTDTNTTSNAAEICSRISYLPLVTRGSMAGDGQDSETFLAADIISAAYILAQADQRWAVADDDWEVCLDGAGYAVDPNNPGPVVPADPEGALRAAVAEASCSQSTGRVQRLADIEAQYQTALIEQQQSALNNSLTKHREILDQARDIVAKYS